MRLCAVLLIGAFLAPPASADPKLQLYLMPDTQAWAWNQGDTSLAAWRAVVKALCAQRDRFAMVLHPGDLVDHPERPVEWRNALSVMKPLDACRMPYAIAFGNHDFDRLAADGSGVGSGDERWRKLLGQLAHRPAASAPSGRTALFPLAPGWFVLALDLVPSRADLDWAAAALARERTARFLLLNHHCANSTGLVPAPAFAWCHQLVEAHPQIRLAVSGHWLGPVRDGWRSVRLPSGRTLVTLFANYQHVPDLAPWGIVIELEPASGATCVWSENLVSGATGHPPAASSLVGAVAASPRKTCFDAAGRGPR